MKLDEILIVSGLTQPLDVNDIDVSQSVDVGHAENIHVFEFKLQKGLIYFIRPRTNITAFIVTTPIMLKSVDYLVVNQTWVDPKERGQGYGTLLYSILTTQLQKKLISDDEQTDVIRKIWKRATKVLDRKTDTIVPREDVPDEEIYINGSESSPESERYRLVMENYLPGHPNIFDKIKEDAYNMGCGDNSTITHPNNAGKYE